jgi:hypothetical protein
MEEKTKIKGCKYCYWKLRQGKYSSCERKLPDHIPESAKLKYNFMLVEKYNNKPCHNFLNVSYWHKEKRKEVPVDTKRRWK